MEHGLPLSTGLESLHRWIAALPKRGIDRSMSEQRRPAAMRSATITSAKTKAATWASARSTTGRQMLPMLGRRAQRGDRLLHELEPLDRPKPDDRIAGELDRDRPVTPREQEPHARDLSVKPDQPPLTPSAVQVSGCWSIPARYASIRRVPTGILCAPGMFQKRSGMRLCQRQLWGRRGVADHRRAMTVACCSKA
jgi:hypothetical protein